MAKRRPRAASVVRGGRGGRKGVARRLPIRPRAEEAPERHTPSATAVAVEALRTGVVPNAAPVAHPNHTVSAEGRKILFGDPDDDSLQNEYVGEDTPGGSTPTPDQSDVDEIGLAYGVKEEDSGELRTTAEVLGDRDRRRGSVRPEPRRR